MAFANNPKLVNSGAGVCDELGHTHVGTGTSAFVAGELVYLASGVVTVCASDAVVIYGQAQEADGASATEVVVSKILPHQIWKIKLYDTSDAAVMTADNFYRGKAYGLVLASSVWYVDHDEVTADAVVFQGPALEPGDASDGSDCYWGLFRFLPTVCQSQTGN